MESKLREPILALDYPVHAGYWYVVDGKPIQSPISGTVADLARELQAQEVRRCDIFGRMRVKE